VVEVRLDFPPGTAVEPILDGQERLIGVKLVPYFTTTRNAATIAKVTSTNAVGRVLDDCAFTASATTGKIARRLEHGSRSSAVPLIDAPEKKKPAESTDSPRKLPTNQ